MRLPLFLLAAVLLAGAQDFEPTTTTPDQTKQGTAPRTTEDQLMVPSGTKVPLVLKHAVSTKGARVGDSVYLETTFPVVVDGRVAIPAGTYVQGVISSVKRAGRVKGRAELLLHFTTLVYPNGYTVSLPGALENVPGAENSRVKDDEGTVEAEGQKGRDAATVGSTAATGAVIGGASRGVKGALVGGGMGAATGMIIGLLTRGQDVRLESGSTVEMVLQRPLYLQEARVEGRSALVPMERGRKLERPVLTPAPN